MTIKTDISSSYIPQLDFQDIIQRSLNEIYVFDFETLNFLYLNQSALDNLGYSMDQMKHKTPLDIKPNYTRQTFIELVSPLKLGTEEKIFFKTVHQRADGSVYPVEVHLQILVQHNAKFYVAIILDITKQEKADEAKRISLERLELVAKQFPDGSITLLDKQLNIIYTGGMAYQTHGINPIDLIGQPAASALMPELYEALQKAVNSGNLETPFKYQVEFQEFVYQCMLSQTLSEQGEFYNYLLVVTDITLQIEQERALHDKQNDLLGIKKALESSALVSITDINGIITDANDQFCRVSQYHREELVGQTHQLINSSYHPKSFWSDMWKNVLSGQTWRNDVRNKAKDGSLYWVDTVINPITNVEGKIVSFLSIRNLITDKKQLQEDLLNMTNRFQLAAKAGSIGVWVWRVKEDIMEWDDVMYELSGQKEFGGNMEGLLAIIHPEDRISIQSLIQEYIKQNKSFDLQFRIVTGNEKVKFVRLKALIERLQGVAQRVIAACWDITDIKLQDIELRQKNVQLAMFKEFLNEGSDALLVYGEDGQLVYINKEASRRLGIEQPNMTEYFVWDIETHLASGIEWERHLRNLKEKGDVTLESNNVHVLYGHSFPVEVTFTHHWINGKGYVISSSRDISERKAAERNLRTSEAKFELAIRATNDGYFDVDLSNDEIFYSDRYFEILGFEPMAEMRSRTFWRDHIVESDRDRVLNLVEDTLNGVTNIYELETAMIHRDGHQVFVLIRAYITRDEAGKALRVTGTLMDLSAVKHAEHALKESEAKLRYLVESTSELICIHEADGTYKFVSKSINRLTGYQAEELIGKSPYDFFHPDDLERVKRESSEFNEGGKKSGNIQCRYRCKDGSYLWLDTYTATLTNDQGEIVSIFTGSRDITELKEAEIRLAESQELLTNIADSIPGLIMRYHEDGEGNEAIDYVSKGVQDLYELSQEEARADIGKIWELFHPEDQPGLVASLQESAKKQTTWKHEYRALMPDGRVKWISGIGQPKKMDGGGILWHSLALDITDKKVAEIELEQTLQKMNLGISTGHLGMWELDLKSGDLIWNDEMYELFDVKQDAFQKSIEEFRGFVHPDDLQQADQAMESIANGEILKDIRFRIITPKGAVKHVFASGIPLHDASGNITKLLGVNIDVSNVARNQEQLEQALIEKDALFKELHHRIKNNLQMVISLLSIRNATATDDNLKSFIKETSTRIYSIAVIHEQLLQLQGINELDVRDYLHTLSKSLVRAYSDNPDQYELDIDIISKMMSIDVVLNLGLIINELVSNVIKYAYPDNQSGAIQIKMTNHDGNFELTVRDWGVGISSDQYTGQSESYGIQLMQLFVEQLGGEIVIENQEGTLIRISFKDE